MMSMSISIVTYCLCLSTCIAVETPTVLPIYGQVVDTQAQPIAGAEVAAYEQQFGELGLEVRWTTSHVTTDEQGAFHLEVPAVSHRDVFVVARKEGYALTWDGVNIIRNNKLSQGRILLVMQKPQVLAGTVVDSQGRAIAHARIQALPNARIPVRLLDQNILSPTEWFRTKSDGQGQFRYDCFGLDQSAEFYVQAEQRACTYILYNHEFADGFDVGRTDIVLPLPNEVVVTGNVSALGSKEPVSGVKLVIMPDRQHWKDRTLSYLPVTTISDSQGRFIVTGVPVGPHVIRVITPEKGTAEWVGWSKSFLLKEGALPTHIKLAVQKGGLVRAHAFDIETNTPLRDVGIWLKPDRSGYGNSHYVAFTDTQGFVTIRALPGRYRAGGSLVGAYTAASEEEVVVERNKTVFVECQHKGKPILAGKVLDAQGQPVSGVFIRPQPWGDEVRSGHDGHFAVGCNREPVVGHMLWARDIPTNRTAMVDVTNAEQFTTLTLQPGLCVRGRITDLAGVPIPATRLSLVILGPGFSSPLGTETLADPQGRFEFQAVPPSDSSFSYGMSISVTGFGPHHYKSVAIDGLPGSTIDLNDIKLHPTDRTISGTAFQANGKPFARNVVCVGSRDHFGQPSYRTVTDDQGRFAVSGVCEGPLQLQADMASSPTGYGRADAWGGDRGIRIVIGKELVHPRNESIVGKPLLPLSSFGMDRETASGKPILLCFVDMEQRPSRRMLGELASQAEMLKARAVQIAVVQATLAKEEQLSMWKQTYAKGIPLYGMKGSIEQNKQDWGIKALPWLILTDKEHQVKAEGFKVSKLDEKLK